uniref:Uncharacterized protein n=1 Tax=Octopus bimaculoides TaxID=37653 RepID=A0A0L8GT76_OCTBM
MFDLNSCHRYSIKFLYTSEIQTGNMTILRQKNKQKNYLRNHICILQIFNPFYSCGQNESKFSKQTIAHTYDHVWATDILCVCVCVCVCTHTHTCTLHS